MFLLCLHAIVVATPSSFPVDLSFDQLFPNSPMKNILDTCSEISGDLACLHEPQNSPMLRSLVMDAVLGKMVRLHNATHQCVLLCANDISAEDIFYVLTMFDRLEHHYKKNSVLHDEHRVLALHFLQESKNSLYALFQ